MSLSTNIWAGSVWKGGVWEGSVWKQSGFKPTDIPQEEADALLAFYHATDGDTWDDNTNWLIAKEVGTWVGVTVAGGNVTALDLSTIGIEPGVGLEEFKTADAVVFVTDGYFAAQDKKLFHVTEA